ncbi:hypothetical protein [Acinetobacter terrestris]|uniref:hypothetical protein n=1 Tax=Acinetobacter terrestris TaxID=2529843 RepID=UPI001038A4BD|nr:hypothetical protein [Acinetobacter terrestris]TCB55315.1 hypothetical protein E0H84_06950 [Acinetobacter terrestris]
MKEFINENKFLKWVAWFFGVLIIGGLGSGFWEMILKPFLAYTGNATINYLTSIFSGFNDDIYKSISIRNTNAVNIKNFSLIVLIFGFFSIYIVSFAPEYLIERFKKETLDNEDANKITEKTRKIKLINFSLICCLIPIVFIISSFSVLKSTYVHKKISHFEYLLKINGDVLNEREVKAMESRFTQIRNSTDYGEIISELEEIALMNNKHINKNPL